jgi:hypothetical protein
MRLALGIRFIHCCFLEFKDEFLKYGGDTIF